MGEKGSEVGLGKYGNRTETPKTDNRNVAKRTPSPTVLKKGENIFHVTAKDNEEPGKARNAEAMKSENRGDTKQQQTSPGIPTSIPTTRQQVHRDDDDTVVSNITTGPVVVQ